MKKPENIFGTIHEYLIIALAAVVMGFGLHVFNFANNFSFGGISGLAVIASNYIPLSPSVITTLINVFLLILGIIILGKSFGLKTLYATTILSIAMALYEAVIPMTSPLTDEALLELVFAVAIYGYSAAILFNHSASSGGTDIIAMILKKYTSFNIGTALIIVDIIVGISIFFIFDVKTGLFSLCGLFVKSFIIDAAIENMNLCKVFTIICENPEPVTEYIKTALSRTATIVEAEGAYSGTRKYVVTSIVNRSEAGTLKKFIKENTPDAFISITNSSDIIGKGFRAHI